MDNGLHAGTSNRTSTMSTLWLSRDSDGIHKLHDTKPRILPLYGKGVGKSWISGDAYYLPDDFVSDLEDGEICQVTLQRKT